MKLSIPILVLIFVATLLSTAASLAGGLIMYFEGLKSLHDTVVETSKSEMDGLRQQLETPVNAAIQGFETILYATYSPVFINDANSSRWVDVIRQQMFSTVRTFPDELSLGIIGAPRDPFSPSALYTAVWSEPLLNGGRSYVMTSYNEHQKATFTVSNATATTRPVISVPVHMNLLEPSDGTIGADIGSFDGGPYVGLLGEWDMERDGGWPDDTWKARTDAGTRVLADKWREPAVWVTSDGSVSAYTGYAALFRPPPPPHPWSAYRMIVCQVELWYTMWQRRVAAFSLGKPDTTVVVYDRKTAMVFATTTADPLVNPVCSVNELYVADYCLTGIGNMSLAIQEAYHMLGRKPYFDLITKSLDGDEFYALNAHLLGDVEIMWLRPTSTIKGKVQKALTYLIIFSVLVLVFDCLVSASEIVFIAMPLKKLEFAIDQIGAMRTEAALEVLAEFEKTKVAVWEMRRVFAGMLATTEQLQEYKAYMPQSVLYDSDEDSGSASNPRSATMAKTKSASGSASVTRSRFTGACQAAKQKTESGTLTRRRRVTVVYCNLRGFLPALERAEAQTMGIHTRYIEDVMLHTKVLHGLVDDLSGDRLSVSFNTVSASTGHEQKGAMLAARIVQIPETSDIGELKPAVAVSAGPALVGNVGCAALKKYSIFGTVPADVRRLLEAGKEWEIRALCNDQVAKQAGTAVMIRHVAPALVNGRRMLVSEIVEQLSAQAAEEWMYQIEKAESGNPHAANNQIMECLHRSSMAEVGKLMKRCTYPVARALFEATVEGGTVQAVVVGCVAPLPTPTADNSPSA